MSFFLKEHCGMKRLKTGVLPAKVDPLKQAEFKKNLEPKLAEAASGKRVLSPSPHKATTRRLFPPR